MENISAFFYISTITLTDIFWKSLLTWKFSMQSVNTAGAELYSINVKNNEFKTKDLTGYENFLIPNQRTKEIVAEKILTTDHLTDKDISVRDMHLLNILIKEKRDSLKEKHTELAKSYVIKPQAKINTPNKSSDIDNERALINSMLTDSSGIVVYKDPGNTLPIDFIIQNIQTLGDNNVKKIYLSGLVSEVHQQYLDEVNKHIGSGYFIPDNLINYLDFIDNTGRLKALIFTAQFKGIKVQALDCIATSVNLNYKTLHSSEKYVVSMKATNIFSAELINQHQKAEAGKFVVIAREFNFTSSDHNFDKTNGDPISIASMTDAYSINVELCTDKNGENKISQNNIGDINSLAADVTLRRNPENHLPLRLS
ncbi:hypothetical protein J2125_002997 [Erwinia toletana]|uniref:Uncharacterized protein n=1 Tax=Winslowiella toletana TaxID=92490 RepID=A0ABS4PAX9_9GAMM|nr:membrane-targeted effector domain-containing toxin [Winslowiella toletana]MBP2169805.1 hypothetical protein [Winslowiella toletana]